MHPFIDGKKPESLPPISESPPAAEDVQCASSPILAEVSVEPSSYLTLVHRSHVSDAVAAGAGDVRVASAQSSAELSEVSVEPSSYLILAKDHGTMLKPARDHHQASLNA